MATDEDEGTSRTATPEAPADPRRRDYLTMGAAAFAGVGAVVAAIPLVDQMNPSADIRAQATTEVDLASIAPGQAIKARYREQPLFVRNLTPKEIAEADAVPLAELRDPQTLEERTRPGHKNWLVTLGICTHLGCVPLGAGPGEVRGPYGGYFCPCHGSMYDTAARIRQGPAPKNLFVPDYRFVSDTRIRVG